MTDPARHRKTIGPGEADALAPAPALTGVRRWWPRPETVFLLIALGGTVAAKYKTVSPHHPEDLAGAMLKATVSDVVFFAGVMAVFALLYLIPRPRAIARLTLVVTAPVALWSLVNAAWLISTAAQFQPGVMRAAIQDLNETRLIVFDTLEGAPQLFVLPGLIALTCLAWWVWRVIRPRPVAADPRHHVRRAIAAAAVAAACALGLHFAPSSGATSIWGQAIGFNSQWYALVQVVTGAADGGDGEGPVRIVPKEGERRVRLPEPTASRPNVVVIFLESVSYASTSMGVPPPGRDATASTPVLESLAAGGVEFVSTHVCVPHTTKALWAGLTGVMADIQGDAAEAVLVDQPYESLPTLLRRLGYRSAFFEMSRGPWEGAPALMANLGFDWAWFRENLEDESANLGWTNGDDFRLIEPMFDWVDAGEGPFLLSMITTVAHDPYRLPDWYEHDPTLPPYGRYLQAVEFSDAFVGAVLAELDRRGIAGDTIVCVLGDHGEVFRPESKRGRWVAFEEAIRIPWLIRWPGHVAPGTRIEWPCAQLDVTPTILSLLGFGIEEAGFDGLDALRPVPEDRRLFFSSWYRDSPVGYREGDRKYVHWPYTDTLFFYDLAEDPGEVSPMTIEGAEKSEVAARIQEWERSSHLEFPARRFRERMLFDHWRTLSSGRSTSAYYIP